MTSNELKLIIGVMDAMHCGNEDIVLIEGRDGIESYPKAKARIVRLEKDGKETFAIGFTYG